MPAQATASTIPFRLDLAGSWHDQPFVSEKAPGSVITVALEPSEAFEGRSGLASSTRQSAVELWGHALPSGDRVKAGRILFCYDNPPGTIDISGSQDALGITLPGLNRLHYAGGDYWPAQIDSNMDDKILSWLELHVRLVSAGPRDPGYDVLAGKRINAALAGALAAATARCWNAILKMDAEAFGRCMRESFEAQAAMIPNAVSDKVRRAINNCAGRALGWKMAGAGGGGYLIVVTKEEMEGSLAIRIARK